MDSTHRVRVPAPLDEAWAAVNDPARLATVLPGALVDEAAGDTFTGTWKIKLGSSLMTLAGSGRYAERDADAHRLVVETEGADRRGDAAVHATHTLTLGPAEDGGPSTDVLVESAMTWSGRPARLGSGVVLDAVDRVLEQAGSRIAARVSEGLPWVAPAETTSADTSSTDDESSAAAVVDHPVELGADLGAVDEPAGVRVGAGSGAPSPSPSPGPAPRSPAPPTLSEYVWKPFTTTAEPHVESARTLGRVVGKRVLPYAGLAALAVFAAAKAVRRARR